MNEWILHNFHYWFVAFEIWEVTIPKNGWRTKIFQIIFQGLFKKNALTTIFHVCPLHAKIYGLKIFIGIKKWKLLQIIYNYDVPF